MATDTLTAARDHLGSLDIEAITVDIRNRAALAQWIEGARQILDGLFWATKNDDTLKARLQQHGLVGMVDWTDVESAALTRMMAEVELLVRKLVPADRTEAAHG